MIDRWIESLQAKYGEILRIETKMYWSFVGHEWIHEVEISIGVNYYVGRRTAHEGAFREAMLKMEWGQA